jgi:hypothetical protein
MKKMIKYIMPLALLFVFASCKKNTGVTNQPYDTYGTPANKGQLKVNLAFAYAIDYANLRIKLNGAYVSNLLQSRTPFPGGGYNTRGSNFALYMSVPLGTNTVSIVMPKFGTNTDSVVLFNTNVNITDNTPQTLHLTDTAANMKSVLVKNNIVGVADGMCRFNFVHLMPNVPAVDLYLNGILMKANIPYLGNSGAMDIPVGINAPGFVSGATTTWAIRAAGATSTSAALVSYASANGLQSGVVLTGFSMGYATATGARLPYLALTLDKHQ